MSESRFNRIKFVEQTKVSPSCPIDIDKAALVLDTTENVVLLQLKLINIGSKVISSVFLKVLLKDAANDFIQNSQPIEHTYNDLNMLPGDKYGEKAPIRLLREVRNVDVEVSKIVYEDGEIWKSENEKTEQIPKLTKLDILGNERISFLKSTLDLNSYDHTNLRYIPVIQNSSWICTCGRFNYNTNLVCKRCNISKEWIQSNFEEDNLDKNYNIFVKQMKEKAILEEKIDQEKKLEEEKNTELKKRIKTRRLRIVSISVFALLVIFSLGLLSTN
ncbi:hypothetical protein [Proteiniclasticum ruminis]|uniref:hypothetical protein n=1 Tax=Proteiniclasticum ruminis TaxID=398199 RepID=UPI0028AFDFC5|nr:hypothetical protein [Proteiniclasticum ruminis]